MYGMGVDEGDCEALGCKLDGKFDRWDYMALKRVGDEDGMRLLRCVCHCYEGFVAEKERNR